jgi:DNA-binding response OmpR family regulator
MKSIRKEKRVLVIDDEPDITIAFKLALEEAGFIVDTSQDPF